ncbi:MAG: NrfD/PsrC family molybdoenzyme membrane anchor subunit [Candidatus Dormibacter sp.]
MSETSPPSGYYDYPVVKRPVWTWEIPVYFWLGGMGAGAFITTSLIQRFGSDDEAGRTAGGFYVAAATLLPCTPLLIKDLGRPDRFHHMLRIFKPLSPMNLGAWTLAALTPVALARAGRRAADQGLLTGPARALARLLPTTLLELCGSALGLVLAGYTGVLLAATNIPLWAKSKLLGGLFTASALSSGSAAVSLAAGRRLPDALRHRLSLLESAASATELALLAGYVVQSGETARPLTRERVAPLFWIGAVGMGSVLPLVLYGMARRRSGRALRLLSTGASLAAIAGSLALRWTVFEAGKDSSHDQAASFTLSS